MKKTVVSILIVFWIVIAGLIIWLMAMLFSGNWGGIGFIHGGYVNVNTELISEKSFSATEFSSLTVNTAAYDIMLTVTDGDNVTVRQYGPEGAGDDELFLSSVSGNTLNISTEHVKSFNIYLFHWGSWGSRRLEIEVPASLSGGLVAKSASGDISLGGFDLNPNSFLIESASGDIKVEVNVTTQDFVIKTASGEVDINRTVTTDKFRLESISGDIETASDISVKTANLSTTSGKIEVERLNSEDFNMNSISGKITVNNLTGGGNAGTTSGDISLNSFTMTGNTDAGSVSGDVYVRFAAGQEYYFEGSSVSGNIRSSGPLNVNGRVNKRGEMTIGTNPQYKLYAHTTSGNINVD